MVIKPRPVITWMLNPKNDDARGIILADCADINNLYILQSGLHELNNISDKSNRGKRKSR